MFPVAEERAALNAILHPRIAAESASRIQALAAQGHRFAVYDAALLVETGSWRAMEALMVVSCSPEVQRARLLSRNGGDAADADARIAAQLPLAEKERVATWVLRNDGAVDALGRRVDEVVAEPARATEGRGVSEGVTLVTGFPRQLARLVTAEVCARGGRVALLARPRHLDDARRFAGECSPDGAVEALEGDVTSIDLGMSGREYVALAERTAEVHHAAVATPDAADPRLASHLNEQGARELLEFARVRRSSPRGWCTTAR